MNQSHFMHIAIELSKTSVQKGGGPFGAVIVRNGEIIAQSSNTVTLDLDPTAHAEINAIRQACRNLQSFKLDDCELYTSCEPCPMCLSAAYWAKIKHIFYGNTRKDAQQIDFDDSFIYDQINIDPSKRTIPSTQLLADKAHETFQIWEQKEDKTCY